MTAPAVGSVRVDGEAEGWNAVAVGTLPLSGGFSLFGKLGTIYSTTKANYSTAGAVAFAAGTQTSFKKNEWNWTYGLGAQYDINKTIALRAEWDRFDGLRSNASSKKTQADLYAIGLNFKF